jgi:hypothetical protein
VARKLLVLDSSRSEPCEILGSWFGWEECIESGGGRLGDASRVNR